MYANIYNNNSGSLLGVGFLHTSNNKLYSNSLLVLLETNPRINLMFLKEIYIINHL